MRLLILLFLFFSIFGGCLDGQEEPEEQREGPEPEGVQVFDIEPGTWVRFSPMAAPDESYSWDLDHNYSYNGPAVLQEFESECAAGYFGSGWVPIQLSAAHYAGGVVAGMREDGVEAWTTTRYAKSWGSQGGGSGMFGRGPDSSFIVGHAANGEMLDSDLVIRSPDTPLNVASVGSFWCLVGVQAFSGGSFSVAGGRVEAAGLHWGHDMSHGVLVRLQVNADEGQVVLSGPTGDFSWPLDGANDLTFCSQAAGQWEFQVEEIVASSQAVLTVAVYDVGLADLPCTEAWVPLAELDPAGQDVGLGPRSTPPQTVPLQS